jgi:glutamate-ammonia-ligase adenylyltransferase
MNPLTAREFEAALNMLPPKLVSVARQRFETLIESPNLTAPLNRAGATAMGQKVLLSLPQVLASSGFISHALHHTPNLIANLLDTDCVLQPRNLKDIETRVTNRCSTTDTVDELMSALRDIRRRELVRIGWRDIAGFAPLKEVVETLSCLADAAIRTALVMAHRECSRQHGEPIGANSGKNMGLVVLGLGKLGGRELNFSSDVDLLFAYPESGMTSGPKAISNQEFFIKVGRHLIRILDEITADGFVFRTDMRLRPNGDSGPLALSFDAIGHYYLTHGREWERYALIKARPVAGDIEDGCDLLETLKPFVYRKYLDFGAFEALRSMKHRIERELLRKNSTGDLKRGRGGIREIEFIVQAHQLIRGGREPRLQTASLGRALTELELLRLIDAVQADDLRTAYDFLRRTEHRLQASEDLQTHQLPNDSFRQQQLATASGFPNWTTFSRQLDGVLNLVHQSFEELFTPEPGTSDDDDFLNWLDIWHDSIEIANAKTTLRQQGFSQPDRVLELLEGLRNSRFYHAFSRVGRDRLDRLMPAALAQCSNSNDPMTALTRLISVIEAIGRRSAYLSLLSENPLALSQLIRLITASRGINSWISQHPVILDELLDPISSYKVESKEEIQIELTRKVSTANSDDLEAVMDLLREFRQGYTLRLAAADIARIISQTDVSGVLSDLAESILAQSLAASTTSQKFETGTDSPHEIGVVAYGKLGSRELGYNSDLDLIFLFKPAIDLDEAALYRHYSRLLQRLIHILTTRTRAGQLYAIDMRLRPDGRSGIAINSIESFTSYQLHKAHPWEHQALVRARMIIGSEPLKKNFRKVRDQILRLPRDETELRQSVVEMRERVIKANCRSTDAEYDLKMDRGGLLDIEFLLQYLVLRWANQYYQLATEPESKTIIQTLVEVRILESSDGARLAKILEDYLKAENALKLQEKPALIPYSEFSDERKWVCSLWKRFLERDR